MTTVGCTINSCRIKEQELSGPRDRTGSEQLNSLVIQGTWNILSFKLHFQNFLKVVQSLLCVLHVSWQVAVDETNCMTVEGQANGDSSFVPLVWEITTISENTVNSCKRNYECQLPIFKSCYLDWNEYNFFPTISWCISANKSLQLWSMLRSSIQGSNKRVSLLFSLLVFRETCILSATTTPLRGTHHRKLPGPSSPRHSLTQYPYRPVRV